jgi:PKD repeat protein
LKKLLVYNLFVLCYINLYSQERSFFTFNAGFVGENLEDFSNKQYYIKFDSSVLIKPYNFINKEYLDYFKELNSKSYGNDFNYLNNNYIDLFYNYIVKENKFIKIFNDFRNIDTVTCINNQDTFLKIKSDYLNLCYKNNSILESKGKLILSPNDSDVFIIKNNIYTNNQNYRCLNSGYIHFKYNDPENGKYFSLNKHYKTIFYQPHALYNNKKWLIAKDSIQYDVYLVEKDTIVFTSFFQHNEFSNTKISDFNSSSGWVSMSIKDSFYKSVWGCDIFESDLYKLDSVLLYSFYNFNNINGDIKLNKTYYGKPLNYKVPFEILPNINFFVYTLPVDIEFSPNDSILYVLSNYGFRSSEYYYCINQPSEIFQIKWNDNFKTCKLYIDDNKLALFNNIELASDGKIYIAKSIYYDTFCKKNFKKESALSVINNPNIWGYGCNYIEEALPGIKSKSYPIDIYTLPENFGRFNSLEFKKNISCKKVANFEIYDTINWQYFDWFINNDSLRSNGKIIYKFEDINMVVNIKIKGTNKNGYTQWFSDTIIIRKNPAAYFTTQTTQGCQYIAFQFKDSSTVFQIKKDSAVKHTWFFGDGATNHWQTYGINVRQNKNHTYTQSGTYTVSHIVSDGYCQDTFSRINQVQILPAPKPGIVANPLKGCLPLAVNLQNKYQDPTDSTVWRSNAAHYQKTIAPQTAQFVFNTKGKYKIYQALYGNTGCVTRDTIEIEVLQGVNTQFSPDLQLATVENNVVLLRWAKVPNAQIYEVFRNQTFLNSTSDSFFIDQSAFVNQYSYQYQIKAKDECDLSTQLSNQANTILAKAKPINQELIVVEWNPYLEWKNGVKNYQINHLSANGQQVLKQDSGFYSFQDPQFLINGQVEKCYQIQATEQQGNQMKSMSNTVCLPYESVIWIPTAISINGDGINESLKINTYGIYEYTLKVFNRWGEKVYESSNIADEWQPKPEEQGVYMYVLKAKTQYGDYLTKGTITVLR